MPTVSKLKKDGKITADEEIDRHQNAIKFNSFFNNKVTFHINKFEKYFHENEIIERKIMDQSHTLNRPMKMKIEMQNKIPEKK